MNIQRLLKVLTCFLIVATVLVGVLLPADVISIVPKDMLLKWAIMACLILCVITLDQKGHKGHVLSVLQYGALFLVLFGALGTVSVATTTNITVPLHEAIDLDECGLENYSLQVDSVKGTTLEEAQIKVVYTRDDHVAFHQYISQSQPLHIDFIEIHPLDLTKQQVVFSVQKNLWRYIILAGEILFAFTLIATLIQILLRALLRKRGGRKC